MIRTIFTVAIHRLLLQGGYLLTNSDGVKG